MRDEEGRLGGAAVGVDRVLGEQALVDGHVGACRWRDSGMGELNHFEMVRMSESDPV